MRRIIFILAFVCLSVAAKAQVRSVGLTLGPFEAVSMQHMVYGTDDVFQLDLGYHTGVPSSGSLRLMASYNIMILSPDWTDEGKWNFYAGPGFYLGASWAPGKGFSMGLMGIAGLEYIFDSLPLQLSVDVRTCLGTTMTAERFIYDADSLLGLVPTVSARYLF